MPPSQPLVGLSGLLADARPRRGEFCQEILCFALGIEKAARVGNTQPVLNDSLVSVQTICIAATNFQAHRRCLVEEVLMNP